LPFSACYAAAEEDELDQDDDTVDVEPEGDTLDTAVTEDEELGTAIGKSPDTETTILFIKPKPGLIGNSGTPGRELFSNVSPVVFNISMMHTRNHD
jgi:hypothetical protein